MGRSNAWETRGGCSSLSVTGGRAGHLEAVFFATRPKRPLRWRTTPT